LKKEKEEIEEDDDEIIRWLFHGCSLLRGNKEVRGQKGRWLAKRGVYACSSMSWRRSLPPFQLIFIGQVHHRASRRI